MRTRGDRGRAAIEDARRSRTCGERDDRDAGDRDDRGRAANADDRDDRDGSFLRISVAWPRNGPNLVLTGVVINDDFFLEFQAILSICPILCLWVPTTRPALRQCAPRPAPAHAYAYATHTHTTPRTPTHARPRTPARPTQHTHTTHTTHTTQQYTQHTRHT